jgi:D-beta-D-heptose 7-phosphate kinase / D-beta-D-heptose 1-phosphate adenosyltransferase
MPSIHRNAPNILSLDRTASNGRAWLSDGGHVRRVGLENVRRAAVRWKTQNKSLVVANGCFDMLHSGHLKLLREAAEQGDRLIVAVNSDSSVQTLKGNNRPIQPEIHRCELLAELRCVDAVICFNEPDPAWLVEMLRPDVLVKGADYRSRTVAGSQFAARIHFVDLVKGVSTTALALKHNPLE